MGDHDDDLNGRLDDESTKYFFVLLVIGYGGVAI
jgi:hypothetical protein